MMNNDTPSNRVETEGSVLQNVTEASGSEPSSPEAAGTASHGENPVGEREKPDWLPEKFWDSETTTPRIETLARSYVELERKLGTTIARPESDEDDDAYSRLYDILGRPEAPSEYQISPANEAVEVDPDVNDKLYEAGFTNAQAQLVYDLAAEHMAPAIEEKMADLEAQAQLDRLAEEFGGHSAWSRTAAQLQSWGESNLPTAVMETLSSSVAGIRALHAMMQNAEPDLIAANPSANNHWSDETLAEMMRDPRYWRQRDPEFIAQVTAGFQELYGS